MMYLEIGELEITTLIPMVVRVRCTRQEVLPNALLITPRGEPWYARREAPRLSHAIPWSVWQELCFASQFDSKNRIDVVGGLSYH